MIRKWQQHKDTHSDGCAHAVGHTLGQPRDNLPSSGRSNGVKYAISPGEFSAWRREPARPCRPQRRHFVIPVILARHVSDGGPSGNATRRMFCTRGVGVTSRCHHSTTSRFMIFPRPRYMSYEHTRKICTGRVETGVRPQGPVARKQTGARMGLSQARGISLLSDGSALRSVWESRASCHRSWTKEVVHNVWPQEDGGGEENGGGFQGVAEAAVQGSSPV